MADFVNFRALCKIHFMAQRTRRPESTVQIEIVPDRKYEVKPDFSRRPSPYVGPVAAASIAVALNQL
jgi:hypothetical protein